MENEFLKLLLSSCSSQCVLEDVVGAQISGTALSTVVSCGVDCLDLFVQLNWTGPPIDGLQADLEELLSKGGVRSLEDQARNTLGSSGEAVCRLCSLPFLLHISRLLLLSRRVQAEGDPLVVKPAAIRCLFIQQRILENRSSLLWGELEGLMRDLDTLLDGKGEEESGLYLELGHISLYYLQYDAAKVYFEKARALYHVTAELTGALGKRTRFQQKDVAQLMLNVSTGQSGIPEGGAVTALPRGQEGGVVTDLPREQEGGVVPALPRGQEGGVVTALPREISIDDDTLLDKVKFSVAHSVDALSAIQQAMLLGLCLLSDLILCSIFQRKTKAMDTLSDEEAGAYLDCVVTTPQCWAVQAHALFLRAQLERGKFRVQQRNLQQLEELVACFHRLLPEARNRLWLFYCVPLQPLWVTQKELAAMLVKMGCLNSAVEVLTRLEMWEDLALCYEGVGRKAKAVELVRDLLAKERTPSLLCLMGDITQEADCYREAWQLSGCCSARAQRSLGLWHLRREEYTETVECLQRSLAINSLQDGLWFSLGCAASQVGNTDLAIRAWHRTVTLEPDFAEAWNNLAGAYLKKQDKERAQHIFKEALRCSYDNPKIWENYLVVCVDLRMWEESLRGYHRLLEMKEKFLDVDILAVLVCAVVKGNPQEDIPPASQHRVTLGKLLGRIAARGKVPALVWKLYSDYHLSSSLRQDHTKGVQELQKAQRAARLLPGWEKELEQVMEVGQLTLEYCRACRKVYCQGDSAADSAGDGNRDGGQMGRKQALASLSSAKLALQGVLSKTKGFGVSPSQELEEAVLQLETEMKQLLQCIAQLESKVLR